MGGILTSLQQQMLETLHDADCELSEDDYLVFLHWLHERVESEQEVYFARTQPPPDIEYHG